MKVNLNNFEFDLISLILKGEHKVLTALKKQVSACLVVKREITEKGYFVEIEAPYSLRLKSKYSFTLGNGVDIILKDLKNNAGTVLFIEDGLIVMLECYTYNEKWPETISNYEIEINEEAQKKEHHLNLI